MTTTAKCTVNGQIISDTGTSGINVPGGSTITIALQATDGVTDWSIFGTQADDRIQADGYLTALNNSKNQTGFVATFVMPAVYPDGRGSGIQFTSITNQGKDTEDTRTFGVWVLNSNGSRLFFGGESNESNATVGNAADLNKVLFLTGITTNPGGSSTQVQFNDGGAFGGDAGLTYNNTTDVLTVAGAVALGTTPATSGSVRGSSSFNINYRVSSIDRPLIQGDSGANIIIGGSGASDCSSIINRVTNGGSIYNQINGANYLTINQTLSTHPNPIAIGTNPATTGTVRLANNASISARDSTNSVDYSILQLTGSNNLYVNNFVTGSPSLYLLTSNTGTIYLQDQSINRLSLSSTLNSFTNPIAIGATPSTTGTIRMESVSSAKYRNTAGNGDKFIFNVSSDILQIGTDYTYTDAVQSGRVDMYSSSGGVIYMGNGASTRLGISAGGVMLYTLNDPLIFGYSGAASAGMIRLPGGNRAQMWSRNNAGTDDIALIGQNPSDEMFIGTNSSFGNQASNIRLYANSYVYLGVGSTSQVAINSAAVVCYTNLAFGNTAAASGNIRLPGGTQSQVVGRNNANSADVVLLGQDTSDNIFVGTTTAWTNQAYTSRVQASNTVYLGIGSSTQVSVTSSAVTINQPVTLNGNAITTSSVTTTESGDSKTTITNTIAHVSTTNATSTTLATFTLTSNAVTAIDVIVQGIKSDYSAAATYKRAITFRNNAGTVATVGSIVSNDQEDNSAWDCTLTNSGTTVTLAVVGVAATNITWTCQMRRAVTIP